MFSADLNPRQLIDRARGIERSLPSATARALNFSAFDARDDVQAEMGSAFDRPTSFTLRSVLVKKATSADLVSEMFVRNQATGGTPPSRYLLPEVQGGPRPQRPFERLLTSETEAAKSFYAPGRGAGASMDQFGNIRSGVIRKILSQLQASPQPRGTRVNETDRSRANRLRRQRRRGGGGSYFVLPENRGKLRAGTIYERVVTAHGSAVRSVLFGFERTPTYRPRLHVEARARAAFNRRFPESLRRELLRLG